MAILSFNFLFLQNDFLRSQFNIYFFFILKKEEHKQYVHVQ